MACWLLAQWKLQSHGWWILIEVDSESIWFSYFLDGHAEGKNGPWHSAASCWSCYVVFKMSGIWKITRGIGDPPPNVMKWANTGLMWNMCSTLDPWGGIIQIGPWLFSQSSKWSSVQGIRNECSKLKPSSNLLDQCLSFLRLSHEQSRYEKRGLNIGVFD